MSVAQELESLYESKVARLSDQAKRLQVRVPVVCVCVVRVPRLLCVCVVLVGIVIWPPWPQRKRIFHRSLFFSSGLKSQVSCLADN